ncbi:DUF2625 domain-containing protein [Flavitalea sp. BT771]|uniref:DUF2625 domain-containing protein n=1 Tax=Flavitalea sp. BT771 TaxID=3063329 RepID=UPI0026E169D9|nr:DUF2625 domain-containing protein [Flavitalea sp. BT771]MDO6433481.1 DUF2625 domain-containing protein [Flavitalea sp. BT771]MDV6222614.1 DUF2625 domain-containing protein [Flavitalea sp. BT771]
MQKPLFTVSFILLYIFSYSQTMRPIEDLINNKEAGWILVQEWIDQAKNKVEVLARDSVKAKDALYKTQVTTRSPMGAVIYSTGGILVDDGWIRILGSGSIRLPRSLPEWNNGKTFSEYGQKPLFYLVADDAIGGFFAINGGALGSDPGKMYYLSPDNLEWEPMEETYTEFLLFCFSGDLEKYYEGHRWNGWRKEVASLPGEKTFNFFPFLWTKEGKDINKVSRKAVPVEEQYWFTLDMKKQLGIK